MTAVVVEAEVDIRRSAEDVFDFCSDLRREPEWDPMMKRVVKLTDGPIGVGARYTTEFVEAPPMVMECTHYERPSAWSLTGESRALKAAGSGRVVPTSEGAHLAMRMELEPLGLLKLARPLLRRGMKSMFQRDLENIKARLEEEERPAPNVLRRGTLAAVKLVHTLAWFSIESCMVYVLWAGFRGQSDRRAAIAAGVVAGESLIFAANGFRCPLTQVAERVGAERGSVTDIYLPRWFARNLPAIHVPLILLAVYLHGRPMRGRRRG
ncbi:MAG: SRPBCC family protein [Solirubrobacteraceae bacterium]